MRSTDEQLDSLKRGVHQRWALDRASVGLDPDYWKFYWCCIGSGLQNSSKFRIRTGFGLSWMEKKRGIFVVKRLQFSNILDYIWNWTLHLKKFWSVFGLVWVLKNQDWLWIAKYDNNPLISGVHAYGQNFQCHAKTRLLRERSGARENEVTARTQWSAHTRNPLTRMTSWYKPDLTYGIQSRVGNNNS